MGGGGYLDVGEADTGVDEEGVADADGDGHAREAPRHEAAGPEGGRSLPLVRRVPDHRNRVHQPLPLAAAVAAGASPAVPCSARHVAEVVVDVHELMIAQQDVHVAARRPGISLQREEEIDASLLGVAAIQNIAQLDKMGASPGPPIVRVD